MRTGLKKRADHSDKIKKAFRAMTRDEVLVGVPGDAGAQPGSRISLAAVSYIQETGSPARNIPARPFLRPSVQASADIVARQMRVAGLAAIRGDAAGVDNALNGAGLAVVSRIKNYIVARIDPALSPATLYRRSHRKNQPKTRDTPLVDLGDMFRAITYVVREK